MTWPAAAALASVLLVIKSNAPWAGWVLLVASAAAALASQAIALSEARKEREARLIEARVCEPPGRPS